MEGSRQEQRKQEARLLEAKSFVTMEQLLKEVEEAVSLVAEQTRTVEEFRSDLEASMGALPSPVVNRQLARPCRPQLLALG